MSGKDTTVRLWTADEIATEMTMRQVCTNNDLLLLGILLQNGATVTLPDNYVGVDSNGDPV